jgi:hydroxymethylpyrimidine pyrophosphatase-like HAD family hydrolase
MTYRILATDYDGTIAFEGQVDAETMKSLDDARRGGTRLIMVTGRELTDLFNTFEHTDVFDRIVAENGAVLYEPATKEIHRLAPAPPAALVERLTREAIPISVGHSVVATVEPHDQAVLTAIRELSLDWHVIFNKGSVMALPSDVTKATGLAAALEITGWRWSETVGVGDAENDIAFLRRSGLAVAVANALPTVKEIADLVTIGARGAGVVELLEQWGRGALDRLATNPVRAAAIS